MKTFLLSLLIIAGGWGAAQDVARAAPPSAEVLWELLGSVSTVDVEARSPDVGSVRFVSMYRGEAVVTGSEDVAAEANAVVTISTGAMKPNTIWPGCEGGMHVFLHHREVRDHGGGSGMMQRCVQDVPLVNVTDHFGAGPLNRPSRHQQEDPLPLPLDTWLLFGATRVLTDDANGSGTDIENFLTYYFMLSTETVTPQPDQWELPAYETWQDAYRAFAVE